MKLLRYIIFVVRFSSTRVFESKLHLGVLKYEKKHCLCWRWFLNRRRRRREENAECNLNYERNRVYVEWRRRRRSSLIVCVCSIDPQQHAIVPYPTWGSCAREYIRKCTGQKQSRARVGPFILLAVRDIRSSMTLYFEPPTRFCRHNRGHTIECITRAGGKIYVYIPVTAAGNSHYTTYCSSVVVASHNFQLLTKFIPFTSPHAFY